MLLVENLDYTIVILLSIVIMICSIGIVVSIKFQNRQKKKYEECLKLIKEKENSCLGINNAVNNKNIFLEDAVELNKLMEQLYQLYLDMIKDLNELDINVANKLDGFIKEFYLERIERNKEKNLVDIVDNIHLNSSSILEYTQDKLKLRININALCYKKNNGEIISGSNTEMVEQIIIITYNKVGENWLINNIENVYEKKVSN